MRRQASPSEIQPRAKLHPGAVMGYVQCILPSAGQNVKEFTPLSVAALSNRSQDRVQHTGSSWWG
jgi:hypothetical protein